jgi:hypothetical protein
MIQRFKAESERYEKWISDILQLNVYCVEPEHLLFDCTLSTQGQADITGSWVKQQILDALKSGHPEFTKTISAMEPSSIHFWTQPTLPCVDNWISNRLVLVGDAAHPFLPRTLFHVPKPNYLEANGIYRRASWNIADSQRCSCSSHRAFP